MTRATRSSIRFATVALLLGAFTVVDDLAAQQPTNYPLKCNLRTAGLRIIPRGFMMQFRGTAAGYEEEAPPEGYCAWAKRGWRDGEPQRAIWNSGEDLGNVVVLDRYNQAMELALNSDVSDNGRETMNRFFQAWIAGGSVVLHVARQGNALTVVRVGSTSRN